MLTNLEMFGFGHGLPLHEPPPNIYFTPVRFYPQSTPIGLGFVCLNYDP